MSKKNKCLFAVIKNDMYPFRCIISFNESDDDFEKQLNKLELSASDEPQLQIGGSTNKVGRGIKFSDGKSVVIRLNYIPKSNYDYSLLQHEIFHVTHYALEEIGFVLSDDSSEAYSYLIQFYTKKIYNKIDKLKKQIK